ncbi:hypothetical protein CRYUN_Cryun22dG0080300 [Craigia yunnanensis]
MTNIIYRGDARPLSGAVELNLVSYLYRVGQVTYSEGVRLQDSYTKQPADFTTRFSFTIDTQGRSSNGHGLAFFIAPFRFQIPLNSSTGFLGLFNTTIMDSPLNQIVVVEFDAIPNPWDPPGVGSHVGINNSSIASAVYPRWNASFHSGDTADVLITVTIGFSASTGTAAERHTLHSWEFTSSLNEKETNGESEKIKIKIILAVSLSVSCTLLIKFIVAYFTFWGSKPRNQQNNIDAISFTNNLERGAGPRRFSYTELVSATNNFSDDRKVGQGGFVAVYKEHLTDLDIDVAVKKILSSKKGKKEFITEVLIISRLRHRNLVKLLRWCHDQGQLLLVYVFMPNCVVHRDIKASNVMLDFRYNVKLSDFGLARLMDHELGPQTTVLAGTLGYLAPEYISSGRPSTKSDIFSFGVVTLEIATGRRSIDSGDCEMGLMDFDVKQAKCMLTVGLWCAHPDHKLRPSIRQAIQVLNFEAAVPVPMYQVPSPAKSSSEPLITNSFLEGGAN